MKRLLICAALLAFALPAPCAFAAIRVVATTADVSALVDAVGGEHVDVTTIAKGYQDPHYLEAKPSHMLRLRKADLLAYVGLELEVGWLPLLVEGARNSDLRAGGTGNLPVHEGVTLLEVPTGELSRAEGDVHPLGNPHYWLSPRNLLPMARNIEARLAQIDYEHADEYAARYESFAQRLGEAITRWEAEMAPYRGQRVICYHKQWEYLFDWLGIEIVGYVENKAGIPPSPKHVGELQQLIEAEKIGLIVISNFFEPGPAEKLASRTGASLLVLPASVAGEDGLDNPIAFFDHLIEQLSKALAKGADHE